MNLVTKNNTQKRSLTLLYTNNERWERKIKETITFTTARKRIKHLGINLENDTKDLYTENYKILMKKSKMTQTDGKIYHVLILEELILWKWLYYPKQCKTSMQALSIYQRHFSPN